MADYRYNKYRVVIALLMLCCVTKAASGDMIVPPAFPELSFSADNILMVPDGHVSGQVAISGAGRPRSDDDVVLRDPDTGDVLGQVSVSRAGKAYADAEILLLDPDTGEVLMSVRSGERGKFVLDNIPQGRYLLRIGDPGVVTLVDVPERVSLAQQALDGFADGPPHVLSVDADPEDGLLKDSFTGHEGEVPYLIEGLAAGESVHLEAPEVDSVGRPFSHWELNGEDMEHGMRVLEFEMTANSSAVARYKTPLLWILPRSSLLPVPAWAPGWVQAYPALAYTGAASAAAVMGVAYYRHNVRRTDRRREILSPIKP